MLASHCRLGWHRRSPDLPSAGAPSGRPGARTGVRGVAGDEEVLRRVSLPASLDRAIEARREVTGESRDEAMASLLRSALRGEDGANEPADFVASVVAALEARGPQGGALVPDLDELAAATARLAEITTRHQAWLSKHHAALDETQRAAQGAAGDLCEFATRTKEVQSLLAAVHSSLASMVESQQEATARALSEATAAASEQLVLARAQVESAQVQMREFEETRAVHLEGLKAHVARYRLALRLTPTVAVTIVGVACVLAVVTSIVFVPTYQKFREDAFVQTQVAPVVRDEIAKSFALLRAENEKQAKEFFELEGARFEKFASHYKSQIETLKGSKAALAEEKQTLAAAYQDAVKAADQWKDLAHELDRENAKLKKSALRRAWDSYTFDGTHLLFLAIVGLPLLLLGAKRLGERWRE